MEEEIVLELSSPAYSFFWAECREWNREFLSTDDGREPIEDRDLMVRNLELLSRDATGASDRHSRYWLYSPFKSLHSSNIWVFLWYRESMFPIEVELRLGNLVVLARYLTFYCPVQYVTWNLLYRIWKFRGRDILRRFWSR